ncbi:YPDG domain-containing protein, partial [Staphylococcus sp. SQ8-PEA]
MNNKKRKRRLDFLPNRQNRYSIRRFTVGTASILIGATLIFGANSEARAAEENKENSSQPVGNKDKDERTTEDDSSDETQSTPLTSETTSQDPQTDKVQTDAESSEESQSQDITEHERNKTNGDNEKQVDDRKEVTQDSDKPKEDSEELKTDSAKDKQTTTSEEVKEEASSSEDSSVTQDDSVKDKKDNQANSLESQNKTEKELSQSSNNKEDETTKQKTADARSVAADLYAEATGVSSSEAQAAVKDLDVDKASTAEVEKAVLYKALKDYSDARNQQPKATTSYTGFRRVENGPVFRAAQGNLKRVNGLDSAYTMLGAPRHDSFYVGNNEYVDTYSLALKAGSKTGFLLKDKISFNKDFTFTYDIGNNYQGNTSNADGWGFMFAENNISDFSRLGGITAAKGLPNAAGFKIDTMYNLATDKGFMKPGQNLEGYGSFVKNDASGNSQNVGEHKSFNYANKFQRQTGVGKNIDGANLNPITLRYSASTGTLTVNYLNNTWSTDIATLGIDRNKEYNYAVTSTMDPSLHSESVFNIAIDSAVSEYGPAALEADEHAPGYNDITTKPGVTVEVPQTKDTALPSGTTFEGPATPPAGWTVNVDRNTGKVTATPPANAEPNTRVSIPVTINYPDHSTDRANVNVTVLPTDAQANDPGYEDKKTKPGVPVESPQTRDKDLPSGTTFEGPATPPAGWTVNVDRNTGKVTATPPADAKPNTKVEIIVKVHYPDKSIDTPNVHITVTPNDAQANDPGYEDKSTKPGVPVESPQTRDKDLPTGTTFEGPATPPAGWTVTVDRNTGKVTATPPSNAKPGLKVDIPVTVRYPDETTDRANVIVTVLPTDAYENDPGYEDKSTKPGVPVESPQTRDKDLPTGTTFEGPTTPPTGWTVTVDRNTGKVIATPPEDAAAGTKVDIPVTVRYPDKSIDTPNVHITVIPTDAQVNDPGYEGQSTKPGVPVVVEQTDDSELPTGTTFEGPATPPAGWTVTVDRNTGAVTATPPVNARPGTRVTIPVTVRYPDKSIDTPNAYIRVVPNDAQEYNPGYEDKSTKPGVAVEVPQTNEDELPTGTRFEEPTNPPAGWTVKVDPDTGTVTATPPENAEPNTRVTIPVTVRYPDDSTDTANVHITVTPNDAQSNDPGYDDQSTKPGVAVEVPQTKDGELPSGTRFKEPANPPEGWTVKVDPNSGKVTATPPKEAAPGTKVDIPVTVNYPDGSTDTPNVHITVTPNDAQSNDPGYEDQSTKPGIPVEVPQTKDGELPSGTTFEGPKDVPTGWTVKVDPNTGKVTATPPKEAAPGTKVDIPVTVRYPDGSTDTPNVHITVTPNDAQSNDPGYEDQSTKPGTPVEVPQTKDGELPSGTTFEGPKDVPTGWKVNVDPNTGKVTATPPKEAAPGTKVDIPVTVRYPDGSTDTPNVHI